MKGASRAASPLVGALAPFADALRSAPHRDAAHVPYGEWLRLYVHLVRGLQQHPRGAELLPRARAAIDAALWSSLFSTHWRGVVLPAEALGEDDAATAATASWFLQPSAYDSRPGASPAATDCVAGQRGHSDSGDKDEGEGGPGSCVEMVSDSFLTEPLLGGASVMDWTGELRASAAAATARDPAHPPIPLPTFTVHLPFTTVLEIKRAAHPRPGLSSDAAALSLQERRSRQALLQSLTQTLQIQHECQPPSPSTAPPPLLQILPLSATAEFSAVCDLPTLGPALTAPPSLALLCEHAPSRLAYLAAHASQHRQPPSPAATVALLTHGNDVRAARAAGAPLVRERSAFATWRQRRAAAKDSRIIDAGAPQSRSFAAHQQARRGCGEAIRRMTAREENIRQSLSQH